MADQIDRATAYEEWERKLAIDAIKAEIDPGKPGECEVCGYHSERLVNNICARCRDEFKL